MTATRKHAGTAFLLLSTAVGAVHAQQPARQHRIAIVIPAGPTAFISDTSRDTLNRRLYQAFFEELRRLGDVEGQNLTVERYSGEGRPKGYADLAREVANRNPDVIVAITNPVALAARAATGTIPIVWIGGDPIQGGLTTSLAHPGGNITGVTVYAGYEDYEIYGKRLQILKEAVSSGRLPAIYGYREYVEAGGLMAYETDFGELFRRMADDVHEIFGGAKAGDIPIYQPTKFQLVIKLKAAKTLGLAFPPALLATADEVIE